MPLLFAHSQEELKILAASTCDPESGARVCFSGTVRKINHDQAVDYLFYEAYRELAIAQFEVLEQQAQKKFAIRSVRAVHLLGRASVGEVAVVLTVLAKHRAPAFMAARFLMDELKKSVPIWKGEYYLDGTKSFDHALCHCPTENDASMIPVKKALLGQNIEPHLIAQKKVLLVGAGGLGCPLAINLAALGIKRLDIFDGDVVNTSNLARQFIFNLAELGLSKALVMAAYLKERFLALEVVAEHRMMNSDIAVGIIKNYDLVVEASDSMATKIMLAQCARVFEVPLISASVYQAEGEVTVLHPEAQGGCFSCFRHRQFVENCANTGVFTHTCSMVGAKASALALDVLAGRLLRNSVHLVQSHSFIDIAIKADPHCAMCSPLRLRSAEVFQ